MHRTETRAAVHTPHPSVEMQLQSGYKSDSQGCCAQINGVCCPSGNMCEQSGMTCNSDCCTQKTQTMVAPILNDSNCASWGASSHKFYRGVVFTTHDMGSDGLGFSVSFASVNNDDVRIRGG